VRAVSKGYSFEIRARCMNEFSSAERLLHEAADGAGATPALGAAAETAIDLAGRARRVRLDDGADILIAQHIARTDDHGAMVLFRSEPNKRSVLPGARYASKDVAVDRHMADGRERQVSGHQRLPVRRQLPQKTDPDAGRLLTLSIRHFNE
jgi:hypothetical protein